MRVLTLSCAHLLARFGPSCRPFTREFGEATMVGERHLNFIDGAASLSRVLAADPGVQPNDNGLPV